MKKVEKKITKNLRRSSELIEKWKSFRFMEQWRVYVKLKINSGRWHKKGIIYKTCHHEILGSILEIWTCL